MVLFVVSEEYVMDAINVNDVDDSDVVLSLFDQCVQARDTFERTMFSMQRHERRDWMEPLITLAQHQSQALEQQLQHTLETRRAPNEMVYTPPEAPTLSTCAYMALQVEKAYEYALGSSPEPHIQKLLTEQLYDWRTGTRTLMREASIS